MRRPLYALAVLSEPSPLVSLYDLYEALEGWELSSLHDYLRDAAARDMVELRPAQGDYLTAQELWASMRRPMCSQLTHEDEMTERTCDTCLHCSKTPDSYPCNTCNVWVSAEASHWEPSATTDLCDIPAPAAQAPAARKPWTLSPGWYKRGDYAYSGDFSVDCANVRYEGYPYMRADELLGLLRAALVVGLVTADQVRAGLEP